MRPTNAKAYRSVRAVKSATRPTQNWPLRCARGGATMKAARERVNQGSSAELRFGRLIQAHPRNGIRRSLTGPFALARQPKMTFDST